MNVVTAIKRLFNWYAYAGTEHNSREERQAIFFFAAISPISALNVIGWAVFYLLHDAMVYWPASIACASSSIVIFTPFIARKSRITAEVFISVVSYALFCTMTIWFGAKSGLHLALLVLALLMILEAGSRRMGVLMVVLTPVLLSFGALPIWFWEPSLFHNASPELLETIYQSNVGNLIFFVLLTVLIITRRAERAEDALAREHERSETLLANLLPAEIAERLKQRPGEIIADELPAVTILFADIVNFTPRAAQMKPEALVTFLNSIFSVFDDLTNKYEMEKIKTIGDAYMVASGLPVERADHAHAAADMALDMLNAVELLSAETGNQIDVRIGLHTGSVIAGVIGSNKVFYDIWGDTVNTAARLESHGDAGRIQVTDAIFAALEQDFDFEPHGIVDLKGKGPTMIFWITGRKATKLPA